jgi:hypothetical protein
MPKYGLETLPDGVGGVGPVLETLGAGDDPPPQPVITSRIDKPNRINNIRIAGGSILSRNIPLRSFLSKPEDTSSVAGL